MNLKTTLGEIKKHNPCQSEWDELLASFNYTIDDYNKDQEVSLEHILNSNGVKDAYWLLRAWDYKDYCLLLADVAESVLHVFENKYPEDRRPRSAIEGIRDYHKGLISKEELKELATAADDDVAACTAINAAYDAAMAATDINTYAADIDNQWKVNEKLLRDFINEK